MKKYIFRKELWGNILTVASLALVTFFPKESKWFLIGTFLGSVLSIIGYRKGYQADNLSKVETKILDAIPNSITGIKGNKNGTK
jgi:hypothetical protein